MRSNAHMSTQQTQTHTEKSKTNKKKVAVAAVALIGLGGVAFAYWTAGGSGDGAASAGSVAALTVNQTSTISEMGPGLSAQTLSGNFGNPNDGPVYVTSVTVSIASVTKAINAPEGTCGASDYTISGATMTVGAEVPAGVAQGSWTGATIEFNNKVTNQDACKGATVNLAYSAS